MEATREHLNDLEIIFRELKRVWDDQGFCQSSWREVENLGAQLSTGRWVKHALPTEIGAMIKASGLSAEAGYFKDVFLVRRGGIDPWLIISPEIPGRAFLADREILEWAPAKVVEV